MSSRALSQTSTDMQPTAQVCVRMTTAGLGLLAVASFTGLVVVLHYLIEDLWQQMQFVEELSLLAQLNIINKEAALILAACTGADAATVCDWQALAQVHELKPPLVRKLIHFRTAHGMHPDVTDADIRTAQQAIEAVQLKIHARSLTWPEYERSFLGAHTQLSNVDYVNAQTRRFQQMSSGSEDDAQHTEFRLILVVSVTLFLVLISFLGLALSSHMIQNWSNTRVLAQRRVLKMLSHDFKGSVQSLAIQLADLTSHQTLVAELQHIIHSIQSISFRIQLFEAQPPQESPCSLQDTFRTLALLFPHAQVQTSNHFLLAGQPCLLHLVLHQMLRNATLHGGGNVRLSATTHNPELCAIKCYNAPGKYHAMLFNAGPNALALAMQGDCGTVGSSGLGLSDILALCAAIAGWSFTIEWLQDGVCSTLILPIHTSHHPLNPIHPIHPIHPIQPIRICLIDDLGPMRMTAVKLVRIVNPTILYDPPPNLRALKFVWQDSLVKTGGNTLSEIKDCIQWVNQQPSNTLVILDRILECAEDTYDGLDFIHPLNSQGAVVLISSGNDTHHDRQEYLTRGAFGCVPKRPQPTDPVIAAAVRKLSQPFQTLQL